MTNEQKKYIEDNIDLIKNNKWNEFFNNAPKGIGSVLYEAGVDWMQELQYIPEYAFYISNIQTVDIPDGITSIGERAFIGCIRLMSINIPDSVTKIEDEAFRGCTSLTNVSIPNSINQVGRAAFLNCGNININYTGTIADWKTLIGGNRAVFKYTKYICNCIDGVVKKLK